MEIEVLTEERLSRYFDQIKDAIVDYHKRIKSWESPNSTLGSIIQGMTQGLSYIVSELENVLGFFVLDIMPFNTDACFLEVAHLYLSRFSPKKCYSAFWETTRRVAERNNCVFISCALPIGKRESIHYKKRLKFMGFKPVSIIYTVEVSDARSI